MSDLHGYQERTTWMGEEILTLADIWPERPRAMIVGLNPAQTSVDVGHYYQGKAGQGQLRRLASAGLFALPRGRYFEDAAVEAGVGFTDIVKRPTKGEDGVTKAEIAHGSESLLEKLKSHAIGLVICVFRHPVKALLGSEGAPGMQAKRTSWGAQVFRMPGPYDKRENVERVMAQLKDALRAS
ncbi:uracil-DNA glycosylase family protein [Leifsonia sp. H3M29-4]|uniref:uracil-DNA glycosylase family protein n=1 Tax=Salinibacterium metalliresistens TaxID=3031321 RepID=UPI0023DAB2EF|nr:uracil-DNA glycosylase family protein [Salinibacterium metalliresistens]MDF1478788.1 uracil-DNA glycosylase family protein [Salinibacterium metalliresistens]